MANHPTPPQRHHVDTSYYPVPSFSSSRPQPPLKSAADRVAPTPGVTPSTCTEPRPRSRRLSPEAPPTAEPAVTDTGAAVSVPVAPPPPPLGPRPRPRGPPRGPAHRGTGRYRHPTAVTLPVARRPSLSLWPQPVRHSPCGPAPAVTLPEAPPPPTLPEAPPSPRNRPLPTPERPRPGPEPPLTATGLGPASLAAAPATATPAACDSRTITAIMAITIIPVVHRAPAPLQLSASSPGSRSSGLFTGPESVH
ncbi:extensin-like [Nannospalax galili]|uniref:extensin-like n=1 Tax=Nannospalax galili TaxID=1026970 RepID=UPI000819DC66|nr:extensin-like [Nannospalax galili]